MIEYTFLNHNQSLVIPPLSTSSMEFTDLFKQTSLSTKPSPNAAFVASIVLHRIIVRDAESMEIKTIFTVYSSY